MKHIWILAAFVAASLASAQTTTTYTGTIKDLTGATVTSGKITFTLNAPSGGSIPGTGSFVATTVSCSISATGNPVSSSDGVSPCVVTNNSALTPTGTSYTICRQPYFVTPGSCFVSYANGGSVDISTLVPTPATQPSYGVASTQIENTWNLPQTFAANASFLAGVNSATINGVVMADQQPGADMCAKIVNAEAVSGATLIDATHFQGAQSCASDMFHNLTKGQTLLLGAATISSTVVQNIVNSGVIVRGQGASQTILKYTGGAAPQIISTGGSNSLTQVFGIEIADLGIAGNNATVDGILAGWTHHSRFARLSIWGVTGAAIHTQGSILDTFLDDHASLGDAENMLGFNPGTAATFAPASLFNFDISNAVQTTAGTVIDPISENNTGCGLNFTSAASMTITGGTSENGSTGVCLASGSALNTFIGIDLESNSVQDVLDNGEGTELRNVIANSNSTNAIELGASSHDAKVVGGTVSAVLIDTGAIPLEINTPGVPVLHYLFNPSVRDTRAVGQGSFAGNPTASQGQATGYWQFTGGTQMQIFSSPLLAGKPWRALFIGAWMNTVDPTTQAMPGLITEVNSGSPTLTVGTQTLTFSLSAGNFLQASYSNGANLIAFSGTIIPVGLGYDTNIAEALATPAPITTGGYEVSGVTVIPSTTSGTIGSGTKVAFGQTCTTGSIGGSALTAGQTATGTCTLGASATGHIGVAVASDGSAVSTGFVINPVTVSGTTATVNITCVAAGTPAAKTYNVTVF